MRWFDSMMSALANAWMLDDPELAATLSGDVAALRPEAPTRRFTRFRGIGGGGGVYVGMARRVLSSADLKSFRRGEILVVRALSPVYSELLHRAGAVVAERGTGAGGVAVLRPEGVPAVLAVRDATLLIRTGDCLAIDGANGHVDVIDTGPR